MTVSKKPETKDKKVSKIKEVKEVMTRRIGPAIVKLAKLVLNFLKKLKSSIMFKKKVYGQAVVYYIKRK
tara:strand:+ start:977 stop:1183 length:207 start_codon:yes stop_codon:yes gene_type:complete